MVNMRDSEPADHRAYTSAPQYLPIRRSTRNLYMSPDAMPPHPSHYHPATSALPPNYGLDLSSYSSHALSGSNSPTSPGSEYLESLAGMPMPEAMDLEIGAPHMDIDLSILSAEEYRDARLLARRPSPARNELQHSKDDGSSSERRRRQRRAPSDDSIDTPVDKPSGKKQRGRPRLDPKDENAADRRRTQIRLAQRAYRLRKETTITTLRTRVTELENIIEGMQNTFFELHESSTECMRKLENRNERESFGETMRSLTERFIALVKAVEPGESLGEEGTTDGRSQGGRADEPRSRDDEAPSSGGSSGNVPMWGGYNLSYPKNNPHDESYNGSQNTSTPRNTYDGATQDQCTSSNIFEHQDIDFFSQLAPEPPSSMTYSFQNATFSRRLHRACLERAYSLLTSPSASQTEVERIFAYTLCYATRDEIVRSVQALLKAGVDQSLAIEDYPELPLHNVPDGTNEALARAKEGRKQLFKLGITGKFLKPTEIEQILVEKGVLETIDTSDSEHESSPASSHDYGYLPPVNASMDSATDVDTLFPSGSPNKAVGAEDIPRTKPIIEKSPLDLDLLVKGETSESSCKEDQRLIGGQSCCTEEYVWDNIRDSRRPMWRTVL